MGHLELLNKPGNNLIDAISRIPGVAQITTGAAVSKPVIRGLSYNRVITLSNGVKQEGQQWGDEHGIEIDQYNAGRVEVLRGAASLIYGSDALGGVINLIDPLPPAEGTIRGELVAAVTNLRQRGSSALHPKSLRPQPSLGSFPNGRACESTIPIATPRRDGSEYGACAAAMMSVTLNPALLRSISPLVSCSRGR